MIYRVYCDHRYVGSGRTYDEAVLISLNYDVYEIIVIETTTKDAPLELSRRKHTVRSTPKTNAEAFRVGL